ncbi:GNAT family N-acetyltransferase [Vibrio sp. SM6]|uniref:GNAT family N-acetyltransferase n=1 Tax=Vibrio agarilyticus TaxID=2726741 RepID=A0A7X8YGD4_9VIBR|nr:GNAT family N-acetyltransferase [Vibrio agarilyticus]NLS12430.1 GNAT family N-acetyltransferase [Vibrio agarilyticus]
MITWHQCPLEHFSALELYHLLQLRVDVFVVEQNCPYPELDGKDTLPHVEHLVAREGETVIACARLLPPEVSYPSASIGRVVCHADHRHTGLGHELLKRAIQACKEKWPDSEIEIGAQAYLRRFYEQHGFVEEGEIYLEDGIEHIHMRRI